MYIIFKAFAIHRTFEICIVVFKKSLVDLFNVTE